MDSIKGERPRIHWGQRFAGGEGEGLADHGWWDVKAKKTCNGFLRWFCPRWWWNHCRKQQILRELEQLWSLMPLPSWLSPQLERLHPLSRQAELLWWHHQLSHCSCKILKTLAKNGKIPRKLAKVKPPKCTRCLFGALTWKAWQTKGANNKPIEVATSSGECVSVNQLISTQVGFITIERALHMQMLQGVGIPVEFLPSALRYKDRPKIQDPKKIQDTYDVVTKKDTRCLANEDTLLLSKKVRWKDNTNTKITSKRLEWACIYRLSNSLV